MGRQLNVRTNLSQKKGIRMDGQRFDLNTVTKGEVSCPDRELNHSRETCLDIVCIYVRVYIQAVTEEATIQVS